VATTPRIPRLTPWQRRWTSIEKRDIRHVEQALRRLSEHGPSPERCRQFVAAIRPAMQTAANAYHANKGILAQWLMCAKALVGASAWMMLFKTPDGLDSPMPVTLPQAEALVRIAKNPMLMDPRNFDRLPGSWRTEDELDRLARLDGYDLQAGLDQNEIRPSWSHLDVEKFRTSIGKHPRTGRPRAKSDPLAEVEAAARRVLSHYREPHELIALQTLLHELLADVERILTNRAAADEEAR
jgi:hypothetical protein